jgi:hypothetical protein
MPENRFVKFALGKAAGHAATVAPSLYTSAQLEALFMRVGLSAWQPAPSRGAQRYAKTELASATVHGALKSALTGHADAVQGLNEFILSVAGKAKGPAGDELREAVRSAGFDLRTVDGQTRLLPLDEPMSPLSGAITALEADLVRCGLTVAQRHYRQAVDCLVDGRAEAANGQMRAMFEEVIVMAAVAHGFNRTKQGQGGPAIDYLVANPSLLAAGDGGDFVRGLWRITHTNGPHPGTSPAGEAYFRVQAITAATRYLIDRLLT